MRFILSLFLVTALLSCNAQQNTDQKSQSSQTESEGPIYTDVSNEQAHSLIESLPNLRIIDVRTDGEVAAGKIEGAQQIDISKPDFESKLAELDREAPVLVYCAGGVRSKKAQEQMKEMGFKEVHNLKNGYGSWK